MSETSRTPRVACSFCGKDRRDVGHLIQGPDGVHICDNCVRLCASVIERPSEKAAGTESMAAMKPAAIRAWLDEHVVGQERAKVALSVAVYNHFKRIDQKKKAGEDEVEIQKGNVLLIGPTGSGKTLLARTIARRLGVPFAMADATTLTEAGYVGEDVESVVKNLWISAGRDIAATARGIVCLDEIDKIARAGNSPSSVRDVGGEGVQQALLKIVEGHKVMIPPDGSRQKQSQEIVQIDTTNILFICCGAFQGLDEIVERRVAQSRIGFGAAVERVQRTRSELLRQVRAEDLTEFGLIPELVGRLPIIVTLDELEERDLVEILWKPRNALVRQYHRLFELEGVKLRFHHDALVRVVQEAIKRGAGARGLRAILESIMLDVMYELPSLKNVRECVITEDVALRRAPPILIHGTPQA